MVQFARLKKMLITIQYISISNSAFLTLFAVAKLAPCLINAVGQQCIDVISFCIHSRDQTM